MPKMTDTRYKLPASSRKFGGKRYTYLALGNLKETDKDTAMLRGKGYHVRRVLYRGRYALYYRAPHWN